MAKILEMTLVEFVATLGQRRHEDTYVLLSQWGRVSFMWIPLPVGGSGYPIQVLERANWLRPNQVPVGQVPSITMERLRRNRTGAWDTVLRTGAIEVTFHGQATALLVWVPPTGFGWPVEELVPVLAGEKLLEEDDNDLDEDGGRLDTA